MKAHEERLASDTAQRQEELANCLRMEIQGVAHRLEGGPAGCSERMFGENPDTPQGGPLASDLREGLRKGLEEYERQMREPSQQLLG